MADVKFSALTSATSVDGTEKLVGLQSAAAKQILLDMLAPPGEILGLQMQRVSATALTVTSGCAHIQSLGRRLRATSSIAKTGLSLTASAWYHVYFYLNGSTPDIEISTTAPSAAYYGQARSKT